MSRRQMQSVLCKVSAPSKRDSVRSALKKAMAAGAMTCGDQIVETKLARQLGVGQGVLREALVELECEGFLHRKPFSNTRVVTLSDEDAQHIFDIRIELEPFAFELAARSVVSRSDVALLRKLTAQSKKGANSGDLPSFFENHLAMFRKVWELSGNKFLLQTLERLVAPLFVLYFTRARFPYEGWMQKAIGCSGHQKQMLERLLAGDADRIKRVVSDCLIQMKAMIDSDEHH